MGKTYTQKGQTEKRTSWNKSRTHKWITTYELVEVKKGDKKKKKKPTTGQKIEKPKAAKPKAAKPKAAKRKAATKSKTAKPKKTATKRKTR
jgi:NAD(P)H-nitrite reductase large subunit